MNRREKEFVRQIVKGDQEPAGPPPISFPTWFKILFCILTASSVLITVLEVIKFFGAK